MHTIRVAALVAAMGAGASAAWGQTACPLTGPGQCSVSVGSTPVPLTNGYARRYQRIIDSAASSNLWCTRDTSVTPAANGIGSFEILAGQAEEYPIAGSSYVPPTVTRCVSDNGPAPAAVETN